MKIYVIRHGLTEMNKQGLINGSLHDALAPEGFEQARQASLSLPASIKRVYSSSLNRAKQTAEILNEKLGVGLTFHDELKEVNFGELEGTPFLEEYKERHKKQDYDWGPSGENVEDVKKRILSILRKIKNENSDGEALIVAHGGIVRMFQFLETNEAMEEIGNASVHTFDLDKILESN